MSSIRTTSKAAMSLAVSGAALAALAGPADAVPIVSADAAGDVLSAPATSDELPDRAEPQQRLGDITAVKVKYGARLVVTTSFRDLAATGSQQQTWTLLTSNAEASYETWAISLYTRPGRDTGTFTVLDPTAYQPGCGHVRLDRDAGTSTLTIPASCLGNPDWVRVGNGIAVQTGGRYYQDDARRRVVLHGWKLGPRVSRS